MLSSNNTNKDYSLGALRPFYATDSKSYQNASLLFEL